MDVIPVLRGCRRSRTSWNVLMAPANRSDLSTPTSFYFWKETHQHLLVAQSEIISEDNDHNNSSMLASLFTSLKESASQNKLSKAFNIFSLITQQTHNASPSDFLLQSLASLFACCSQVKAISQGKQLHAYLISSGFENSRVLVPKLVTFYCAFDLFNDAYIVTESSKIMHPLPWNVLISGYVRAGLANKGLSVYKKMLEKKITPDNFTYPSVLKACGEEFNLGLGREVHESIVKSTLEWNLFVHNALVFMYAKCGDLNLARILFDEMPVRDEISWNSIISGYASQGMWTEAFELFHHMQNQNVEVNIIIWNTIAGGYLKTGNYTLVLKLLSQLKTSGKLDPVSLINGLSACSHIGLLNQGKEIHGLAIRTCCHDYDNVKNALITMYSRCKDLKHAHIVFHMVENKSVITWNSIISGFSHFNHSEESLFLFREMLLSRVNPNYVTIASILPLCARVANLNHGKELHCYITRHHELFKDYLLIFNSLIEMYARSGKIILARRLFDSLDTKDEVTYTSLIAGYGIQGEGRLAIELFEEMIRFKIKPDHVTMVAILSACSHSALVDHGQSLFEKMFYVYKIVPRLEHYSCMVDLYGRAGLLGKAEETMRKMPFKATPAMWATVIGGCRIHGKKELGEMAGEKLLEMKPRNSGYYVLVANMYADFGFWKKLGEVRMLMRELGVKKVPGCAWLDVGGGFMRFLVADMKNVRAFEMYSLLDGLSKQLKEAGYVMSDDKDEAWNDD